LARGATERSSRIVTIRPTFKKKPARGRVHEATSSKKSLQACISRAKPIEAIPETSTGRLLRREVAETANKWTALTVTTVGVFMASLDGRIIIVGLPQMAAALSADAEQAIWFTQAYLLTQTIFLILAGRVADIFGRVRMYTFGFAVFTVASALTSLSQNPLEVIAFRGLQGFGSAIILTNGIALITDYTPRNELGFSIGINQVAVRIGAVVGLTLSGIILSFLDWRALFYINVPVGIFGTIWSHRRLKDVAQLETGTSIDWLGALGFTTVITGFLLALTFAAYGGSAEVTVYALAAVTIATAVLFVVQERRSASPLIDFRLLRIREVAGGLSANLLNVTAFGAVMILLSLYFQMARGLSPFDAGVALLPFEVAFLATGPLAGRYSDRFGHIWFTTSGLVVTSSSLFLLSTVSDVTPLSTVSLYLALLGAGIGLFSSPNSSSILGAIPAQHRGIGAGVRNTVYNVAYTMSLNVAILVMASYMPYSIVTAVIASGSAQLISLSEKLMFVNALRVSFFWLGVIDLLALPPSILRGRSLRAPTQGATKGGEEPVTLAEPD
jgi:EmrB/QacA subfamily drug resistance transporter